MAFDPNHTYVQSYPSKTVWVSSGDSGADQTVSGSIRQLSRIQSIDWSAIYNLQDNTYVDAGIEPYYPLPNGIDLSLSYLHTNARNEYYLGLAKYGVNGNLELGLDEEHNMFIPIEDTPGLDSIGAEPSEQRMVIGLAQGVLTAYSLEASVGGMVRGNASLNYLTATIYTGSSGMQTPAVNYQNGDQLTGRFVLPIPQSLYDPSSQDPTENVSAIGARDMVMMFPSNSPFAVVYTGQQACYLQSFSLSLDISRQEVKPLGYVYPLARPVTYPIRVNLTTDAIVSRYQADQLSRISCTSTGHSVNVVVKQPCSNLTMFGFYFDNLQVESQSFRAGIGPFDTVTTQWRGWLKSAQDTFISPVFHYIYRLDNSGAWGENW